MGQLKEILARVLHVEESSVGETTSQDDIETWDSLNVLVLASELEKAFKIKFTMQELATLTSVKNISAALAKHGVTPA